MGTLTEDQGFEHRFRRRASEIIRDVLGTRLKIKAFVAPAEDDWRHNKDFGTHTIIELGDNEIAPSMFAVAARFRRHQYTERRDHLRERYIHQFTIRQSRPSGAATEADKLLQGFGHVMLYGFEAEPGSHELWPWVVINLQVLRDFDPNLSRSKFTEANRDGSSTFVVYSLPKIPSAAWLASGGIPAALVGAALTDDRRYVPYLRDDDWAETTRTYPNPDGPGWLCQRCETPASVFYGKGPWFDPTARRYVGVDERVCLDCFKAPAMPCPGSGRFPKNIDKTNRDWRGHCSDCDQLVDLVQPLDGGPGGVLDDHEAR